MSAIERALQKQRLLLQSAQQRAELAHDLAGLAPFVAAAERVHGGVRWLRRHPEALGAGVVIAAILRPGMRRFLWRWGRRAFLAWRFWRQAVGPLAEARPGR